MEGPKFQSSFIPKGPVAATNAYATSTHPKGTLLGYVSTIFFVIALVAAAGLFGYERYLIAHISTLGTDLAAAKQTLQPDAIKELVRTNDRLHSTQALLARHTALTPLLSYLETATLKNVRFTHLDYGLDKGSNIILELKGQARSYTDVALQSDAFNKSAFLKTPVFSDLDLDSKGNVTFTFTAVLDSSIVAYQRRLDANPAMSAPSSGLLQATTTATSTAPVAKTATTTAKTTATTTATSTKSH